MYSNSSNDIAPGAQSAARDETAVRAMYERAPYTTPTAPWIDHSYHPCERAYEVPNVFELVRAAGFEVHRMLGQGREYAQLIPSEWRPNYDRLPDEAKWRLSELLAFRGGSFRMILRKSIR